MKKIIVFLVLILLGLILTGYSPEKRVIDPKNKDVFIKGKLTFKNKDIPAVKFWVEGDAGYYSVIIYEENGSEKVTEATMVVSEIFQKEISSSVNYYVFNYNKIDYSIIDFDNKKTKGLRGLRLLPLGLRIVKNVEKHTGGKISGYVVW